jgi:hypothetical protein
MEMTGSTGAHRARPTNETTTGAHMDVMGIAKLATSIADTGTRQDVAIAVMKKAQDIEAAQATQLLEAVQAASPAPNLPPHLGNHVNTTA